ncbi:MAG TPA: hypothetical protein VGE51_08605 [Fontimonas sp.]
MRRSRSRLAVLWLSIVTLLAQLVLPAAHAQSWAKRAGDPLAYALCGSGVSPALMAQWLQNAPEELRKDLQEKQLVTQLADCGQCLQLHAPQAPGGSHALNLQLENLGIARAVPARLPAQGWQITDSLHSRGPPTHA